MSIILIKLSNGKYYAARKEPETASCKPLSYEEKIILDLHGQIKELELKTD